MFPCQTSPPCKTKDTMYKKSMRQIDKHILNQFPIQSCRSLQSSYIETERGRKRERERERERERKRERERGVQISTTPYGRLIINSTCTKFLVYITKKFRLQLTWFYKETFHWTPNKHCIAHLYLCRGRVSWRKLCHNISIAPQTWNVHGATVTFQYHSN